MIIIDKIIIDKKNRISYQFCRCLDNKPFNIVRNYIRLHHIHFWLCSKGGISCTRNEIIAAHGLFEYVYVG